MATAAQRQNQQTELGSENQADRQASNQNTNFESKRQRRKQEPDSGEYGTELKYRSAANVGAGKFAKGLGYFSIGLGLMELLMPAQVADMAGLGPKHRRFLPVFGLREIASGIAILYQQKPTESVWSRVGGDAMDLAFLGSAYLSNDSNKDRLPGAILAIVGVTAIDIFCAQKLSSQDWGDDKNPTAPTTIGQSSGRQSANGQ